MSKKLALKKEKTFSQHFGINKSQGELDFVDIPVDADIPLFVDPYAISQRTDPWSQECNQVITGFFQLLVDHLRKGDVDRVRGLMNYLREPNETHLGVSKGKPKGAGLGQGQAQQVIGALQGSAALKTGILQSLGECELMIDGISRDKISDLTTNLIRKQLAEYTKNQCDLWGIPTQQCPLPPHFDVDTGTWRSRYYDLPVISGKPVLLVPKVIARYDMAYDHAKYYDKFVISFLQAEHYKAGSGLVTVLKSGKRVVHKKDVKASFPIAKQKLYEFSKDHPEVLDSYRKDVERLEKQRAAAGPVSIEDEKLLAKVLAEALQSVPGGSDAATDYHDLMLGILELLFHPMLLNPKKEHQIHDGRKRIDIVMENGAKAGTLFRLHDVKKLPCAYVPIECKNYTREVENPELDQIAGRFSTNRGRFGIICCRNFEDRAHFVKRCRDTFRDDRGLIVALDDAWVLEALRAVEQGERDRIETMLRESIDEVWASA